MEDWQQRVIEENDQLIERVKKLQLFFASDDSYKLDAADAILLDTQLLIMIAYGNILERRIDRFAK